MPSEAEDFDFGDEPSRLGRLLKLVVALAVVGGVAAGGWYFLGQDDGTEAAPLAQQEVQVSTGQLVSSFSTSGSAGAELSADLSFGVAGTVETVSVSEGDVVSQGQEIARLQTDDAVAAIASAEASLEIAQLQLENLFAGADNEEIASAAQSVTNAINSVASAENNVKNAKKALDAAYLGPDDSALKLADNAISQAETSLQSAENQMDGAEASLTDAYRDYCGLYSGTRDVEPCNHNGIGSDIPLDDQEIDLLTESLALQTGSQQQTSQASQSAQTLVSANGQYESAALNLDKATDALSDAEANRLELFDPPSADTIADLEEAIESAERSLGSANLGLTVAYARQAAVYEAPDPLELAQREEAVHNAERQLEKAREDLAGTILVAPFGGTIASLTIEPGSAVSAATIVAIVTDTEQIMIALTVSETNLAGLSAGQFGLAEFSALADEQYLVEVISVAALPDVTQGVVTYPVVARVLGPGDLNSLEGGPQQITQVLTALSGDGGFAAGDGGGAARDGAAAGGEGDPPRAGRGAALGGQAGGAAGLRQILALTTQDEDGTLRLQEGAEIPDDLELPEELVINDDGTIELPEGLSGFGGAGGFGGRSDAAANPDGLLAALLDAPLPSPGMSANVTILKEIQADVLLVPNSAVSIQSGAASVRVLNADGTEEARSITIGDSDASNTIVLSGLANGETILVVGSIVATPVQPADTGGGLGRPIGQGGFAPGGGN